MSRKRPITLPAYLALRLGEDQRIALERMADENRTTLGEAARMVIDMGLDACRKISETESTDA